MFTSRFSKSAEKSICHTDSDKSRKQSVFASLLIGLILVQAVSLQNPDCPEKDSRCIACDGGYCEHCAFTLAPKKGGSQKECTDTRIKIPNCWRQGEVLDQCHECLKGYHLSNDLKTCIKGGIDNCFLYDSSSEVGTTTDQFKVCFYCKEGFANDVDKKKECLPVDENKKVANCEFHGLSGSGDSYFCRQCKKGYSKNKANSIPDACEKVSEGNEGCSIHKIVDGKQVCTHCRFDDDYFITRNGCKKIDPPADISNPNSGSNSKFQNLLSLAAFWVVAQFLILAI